jgi:hypothetical protein
MPGLSRRGFKDLGLAQLRSFREVCRLGGYAPAARVLLLTPAGGLGAGPGASVLSRKSGK